MKDRAALAGTLSLVREQKERIRVIVEQRKQLGFPVPDGVRGVVERVRGPRRRAPCRVAADAVWCVVSPITESDCPLRYGVRVEAEMA